MSGLEKTLETLVGRLEHITARLEAVEGKVGGGAAAPAAAAAAPAGSGETSAAVAAYDDLTKEYIDKYVALSAEIDPLVAEQANVVKAAIDAQREFLNIAAQSKKPDATTLQSLIKTTSEHMAKVGEIRDKNRASKFFNHLSTLSEGIGALGWVVVEPTPGPHVNEMRGSSEFYSNRVLKEYKGNDEKHVQWVRSWNGWLKALAAFIKQHHTTGVTWNPRGGDAKAAAPAPAKGGAGPPPPAPSASSLKQKTTTSSSGGKPPAAALFAELNKGGAVTAGLKKVDRSQMTHKNPALRGSSVVPASGAAKKKPTTTAKAAPKRGTPKIELNGNKWIVDWQFDNKSIVIDETETKQTVYIYKCENSVVQVKGKVNALTLDQCKKVGLVFENAVSSVEVVNCRSVQVQCTGRVPVVSIDRTAGCQVYVSKENLDCEFITATSSEMNVNIPGENANDDPTEVPIAEQFKTVIKGKALVTGVVEHGD